MIASCVTYKEVVDFIAMKFPQFKSLLPTAVCAKVGPSVGGAPNPHPTRYNCEKVEKLLKGPLFEWQEMVTETIRSLIEHKLVKSPSLEI